MGQKTNTHPVKQSGMDPSQITVETVFNNPTLMLALTIAIVLVHHYVKQMPYSEFVLLTQIKHRVFAILAPFAATRGLEITRTKGYRDDEDEYVATTDYTPRELAQLFKANGIVQHIISRSKRRETPNGRQWTHSHWVYQHDNGKQTEIWLFVNPDGTTDIQAHYEESVFDPDGHLETPWTPGDPKGVLDPILP